MARVDLRHARLSWRGAATAAALLLCLVAATLAWLGHLAGSPISTGGTVVVAPGQTLAAVLDALAGAGQLDHPRALRAWARLTGRGDRIIAGEYAIRPGTTPARLLADFAAGRVLRHAVRLPEGATFRAALGAIWAAPAVTATLRGRSDADIMSALGSPALPAEGWFLPDTYFVTRGETDLALLRRSHAAMRARLDALWAARGANAPSSAEDAVTLASLVEKETGRADERALVAAVLLNRLRQGMPLQIDSTVIYGLGGSFDGNLTRRHLQTATPHNTYTRRGLPATPIALPSEASLVSVLHPAPVDYLYFVARGDGSHVFSRTLAEHNRAVDCYQRQQAARCRS
ncbi:MAG: endolytic transglycosylase MltG [Immundisolibacter sp.]|uniref:endolytic transglycosylase MltG n=1 Tax=Immundisolibacter sp. TaxID=1934948 RepID=UPI003D111A8A